MKLLVDTCTLIWLATAEQPVPQDVRSAISDSSTEVYVSAASAWEIAIKYAKRALLLRHPPAEFMSKVRTRYGLSTLPIDEDSALHVAKLPPLHADPFDRMLVSQAIVHGLTIVTPDPLVTQYPALTMW